MSPGVHEAAAAASDAAWRHDIDGSLAVLRAHSDEWARLPIAAKIDHLRALARKTSANADRWVRAACRAKGIDPASPLAGEEWSSGPWALLFGINRLVETLTDVASDRPRPPARRHVSTPAPTARWSSTSSRRARGTGSCSAASARRCGCSRGVTEATLPDTMAVFYRQADPAGAVALVLGAGNIASIPPLDVLYKMYARGPRLHAEDEPCQRLPRAGVRGRLRRPRRRWVHPLRVRRLRGRRVPHPPRRCRRGPHHRQQPHPRRHRVRRRRGRRRPQGLRPPAQHQADDQRARQRQPHHRRPRPLDGARPRLPGRAHRHPEAAQRRLQLHRLAGPHHAVGLGARRRPARPGRAGPRRGPGAARVLPRGGRTAADHGGLASGSARRSVATSARRPR